MNSIRGITLLVMVSCISCQNRSIEVTSSSYILTEANYHLETLFPASEQSIFLAGAERIVKSNPDFPHKDSNQFATGEDMAVVFWTGNEGKSWSKTDAGIGRITSATQYRDRVYFLKEQDDSSDDEWISFDSVGRDIQVEWNIPRHTFELISTDTMLLAIMTDSIQRYHYYRKSVDDGMSWSAQIRLQQQIFSNVVVWNNNLVYLGCDKPGAYYPNKIYFSQIDTGIEFNADLPPDVDVERLATFDNMPVVVGRTHKSIRVFQMDQETKFDLIGEFLSEEPIRSGTVFCDNASVWILARFGRAMNFEYKLLRFDVDDKSWAIIDFEISNYVEPYCFKIINGQTVGWFYSGRGRIQKLK
jgi:hypothetical protein